MGRLLMPSALRLCFGCHATAATTSAGFDPTHLMPGVTCEACHGPGAEHVALMDDENTEKGRVAIFNPSRLSPVAMVDFCGACHRTLNDVMEIAATGVETVRFQPYRLESSRCWGDGDARLTCIACHDPHQQLVRDAGAYDAKCLACHVVELTKKTSNDHPGKRCPVAKKNCVTCHMPRVDLPSMHAPFTDHRIRIVRRGVSQLKNSLCDHVESALASGSDVATSSATACIPFDLDVQANIQRDVLKAVKGMDPRIGCCIDVGHTVRAGTDVVQAIHEVGPRLFNMHMKDLTNFQS